MENILFGHKEYVLADFKLGRLPFGRNLCEERYLRRIRKAMDTTSFAHGFRFTGMAVHTGSARLRVDKSEGRRTTYEETQTLVRDVLFGAEESGRVENAVGVVIEQLGQLRDVLKASSVVTQGSSALLLFDLERPGRSLVRLVDFTYAYTSDGRQYQLDDQKSTLDGIDNLVAFLAGMRCE